MHSELKQGKKILIICLSHSWGGLEKTVLSDVVHLSKTHDVICLCYKDTRLESHLLYSNDSLVWAIPVDSFHVFNFLLRKKLKQLEKDTDLIVHCHQPSVLNVLVFWLDWSTPLAFSRHIWTNVSKKSLFHWLIYKRLNSYIVMSKALEQNVLQTHPVKSSQCVEIPLGVDEKVFHSMEQKRKNQRDQWKVSPECWCIGVVGRIQKEKGQYLFLEAAHLLIQKTKWLPQKVQFFVVGEKTYGHTEDFIQSLRRFVIESHLEAYVQFLGFSEQIADVMAGLDIFLMPSDLETFGLVAIEAMQMGCSVILSNAGSAPEIIDYGACGVLCSEHSGDGYYKAIQWIIDHPTEKDQMRQKALQKVQSSYTLNVRLQKTLFHYENLWVGRSGGI